LAAFAVGSVVGASSFRKERLSVPFTIKAWPWYEDGYFNIKFQYPPEWKVEKVDVTNYYDDSGLDLAGEDAALAGPDRHRIWILRIAPPNGDILDINLRNVGTLDSALIIDQPDRLYGNNHFRSDVTRPKDYAYESVLDPYDETFRFNFTSHATFGDGAATTSISVGHSRDGKIAGITAVKLLPLGYHFQSHMTMTEKLGHSEDNMFAFVAVVSSMRLLFPERRYEEENYRIPIPPSEFKPRNF
jgi:hypothetical protein